MWIERFRCGHGNNILGGYNGNGRTELWRNVSNDLWSVLLYVRYLIKAVILICNWQAIINLSDTPLTRTIYQNNIMLHEYAQVQRYKKKSK